MLPDKLISGAYYVIRLTGKAMYAATPVRHCGKYTTKITT